MLQNPILQALRGGFDAHPAIQEAYLYGSVARGDSGGTSNVGVALLADLPIDLMALATLGGQLEAMVHRPADVVDLRLASPMKTHHQEDICIG